MKWLSHIHVQEDPFLGKFQSRWYRTMCEQKIDGETVWNETAVTHMRLKSVVARVTKEGSAAQGVRIRAERRHAARSVEVKVDNGPWQAASLAPAAGKFAWKQFSYTWRRHARRAHDRLARDRRDGYVQPESLPEKKTFLEDNSQFPRKVMIA